MIANVSHARAHLECPTKAYYINTLRRVRKRGTNVAMEVGIAWHKAMETYLTTKDKNAARAAAMMHVTALGDEEVYKGWDDLLNVFDIWECKDDWQIVATEKVIEVPMGAHRFVGTLDSVVLWNGKYWHLQHKTVHASKALPAYWAYMQRDWHECMYEKMCEISDVYQPYGGTILNVVKKLSSRVLLAEPSRAINIQYLSRSPSMVDKAWEDMQGIVYELAKVNDPLLFVRPQSIRQNRSACAGVFGNSLCPYIDVCNEVLDINDDTEFVTEEDRYAQRLVSIEEL